MEINTHPQTNTQAMPITPNHQQLIDGVLQLVIARVIELTPVIGYSIPPTLTADQARHMPARQRATDHCSLRRRLRSRNRDHSANYSACGPPALPQTDEHERLSLAAKLSPVTIRRDGQRCTGAALSTRAPYDSRRGHEAPGCHQADCSQLGR